MKVIRIRTIDEAKRLNLPDMPPDLVNAFRELQKRAGSGNLSRHAVLRSTYELLDKATALYESLTVCTAGCSSCCRIRVVVTELEASFIAKTVGRPARRGVRTVADPVFDGSPCPFLAEGSGMCTVYQVRPFACRTYATFDDPQYCANGQDHMTINANAVPLFLGTQRFIRALNGAGAIADIRAFFTVA